MFKTKLLYLIAVASIFVILFFNNLVYTRKPFPKIHYYSPRVNVNVTQNILPKKSPEPKHILLWTNPNNFPFVYFGNGNSVFRNRKCKWSNCYVTGDRLSLRHYKNFDVIAFNGPQLSDILNLDDLPTERSAHQKYVYANIEAATNYPVCSSTWDGFFNWTWTYKLNSDAVWGYVLVRNATNHVVAPSVDVRWMDEENMDPIEKSVKMKLSSKTKAAAWFVSNCLTSSYRENFVTELQMYMRSYNLVVDIYGSCGPFFCPKTMEKDCLKTVEKQYYFYFAFENALTDDYVTEKILNALNYYTVPVVFGGANYSRFMPPSSYLNARELGTKKLAKEMYDIIQNPARYHKFFRWRKYYSYHLRHEVPETDDYCRFCAMMNDEGLINKTTEYNDFSNWWTGEKSCSDLRSNGNIFK